MRIAARPSQVVPLIHASPLACTPRSRRVVTLVGLEADEHLVQLDIVQNLGAELAKPVGESPRVAAGPLDQLGDPAAAELADRRVDREAAGAAGVLGVPVDLVARLVVEHRGTRRAPRTRRGAIPGAR